MLSGSTEHAGLQALLEFESTRLGLAVHVRHTDLNWISPERRDVVQVLIHDSREATSFGLHLDDQVLRLNAPLWLPPESDDVHLLGPPDDAGAVQPLVSVAGHNVAVHVPPRILGSHALAVLGPSVEKALPLAKSVLEERVLSTEMDHYEALKERTWSSRLEERRLNVTDAERSVLRLEEDLRFRYRNLAERREELRLLETHTLPTVRSDARTELERLRGMVPRALQAVRVSGNRLVVTTTAISLDHEGFHYEFGRYEIVVHILRNAIRIHALDGGRRGHPHPHVISEGEPCLGNLASTISHLLGVGDVFGLIVALLEYLASYNPASPYVEIEHWDPDYEDSRRHDDCYEEASLSDCLACDDEGCPYWEGRYDRCWENQDSYVSCIECGECDRRTEAQDLCRGDHSPQECFLCPTQACAFAGDADACFDDHDGDDCPHCNNESCRHWRAATEGEGIE